MASAKTSNPLARLGLGPEKMERGILRFSVRLMFAVALPGLAFTSCQRESASAGDEILYWSANLPYEQEFAKQVVAEWNTLHPESPVVHQPVPEGQSSEEVILASIAAKTTPDIYSNVWPGDTEFYVRARSVVCLSDIPEPRSSWCNAVAQKR